MSVILIRFVLRRASARRSTNNRRSSSCIRPMIARYSTPTRRPGPAPNCLRCRAESLVPAEINNFVGAPHSPAPVFRGPAYSPVVPGCRTSIRQRLPYAAPGSLGGTVGDRDKFPRQSGHTLGCSMKRSPVRIAFPEGSPEPRGCAAPSGRSHANDNAPIAKPATISRIAIAHRTRITPSALSIIQSSRPYSLPYCRYFSQMP